MADTWHIAIVCIATFYISVATILGTGILALPGALYKSGLWPFIVSFSPNLIIQSIVILYMVELLQKTLALQNQDVKSKVYNELTREKSDRVPLNQVGLLDDTSDEEESLDEIEGEGEEAGEVNPRQSDSDNEMIMTDENQNSKKEIKTLAKGPDLHSMGTYFLPGPIRILFDIVVMAQFISALVGYSLAGPESIIVLFDDGARDLVLKWLIMPFVIIFAFFVIFLYRYIQPVISFFTIVKTLLLIVMIIIGIVLSVTVNENYTNDWQYISRPFLLGTVAMGGVINTLPMIYSKMKQSKINNRLFAASAIGAVVYCWLMNVIWCWVVLKIVPQDTSDPNGSSLKQAYNDGNIATTPISHIINSNENFKKFKWLIHIMNIFVAFSIVVSYITMSAAFKHTLDGYVKHFNQMVASKNSIAHYLQRYGKKVGYIFQILLYVFSWASIAILAQAAPDGFELIMESFRSFGLNLESGVFISLMVGISMKYKIQIADPMNTKFLAISLFFVAGFFIFACLFDIVYTILRYSIKGGIPF